ncbi:MAG: magnesium/cobalt transporter CorA [Candidatus Cloacimonetes bacterium]|nr:magnesium/cobalt transporter CorA [Candidatus Cloacimonadota bacterium]
MSRQLQKMKNRIGLAPGSLVHIGTKKAEETRISVIDYNLADLKEQKFDSIRQVFPFFHLETASWINIDGLHDLELFSEIVAELNLHPLLMEDILDTGQRPKLEAYDDHLLLILKMITWNDTENRIDFEQVSFILGENYILSFQERQGDVFEHVRQRIRNPHSRIRKMKIDYLLYSLVDAIIDSYFLLISNLGDKIEEMEEALIKNPTDDILSDIHHIKRDVLFLRKSVWHLRSVISNLNSEDFPNITPELQTYLRDLYDNTIQVMDTIETYREIISGMLDIYLSSLSNRMNQVMKVLTIFAAIFIPLTFVAGVYGMNFHYMPELSWKWAYPIWWLIVIIITGGMVYYFKKKKWM